MSLCYYCGKEEETEKCPHCGISYCKEHLAPEKHMCIAYEGTSAFKRQSKSSDHGHELITEIAPETQNPHEKEQHNKVLIAVCMVLISVSSSYMVAISAGGAQGLHAVVPAEVDYELHSVVYSQVNTYRYRNDLPELEYEVSDLAQEWAFRLARTGELQHNPELPSSMGENIARRTERGQDPKVTIALMVQDMVSNDKQYSYANRNNILGAYDNVIIGVAVDGDTVILVLNFK